MENKFKGIKGFIELHIRYFDHVTNDHYIEPMSFNINNIISFSDGELKTTEFGEISAKTLVNETYGEIKNLIKEATTI